MNQRCVLGRLAVVNSGANEVAGSDTRDTDITPKTAGSGECESGGLVSTRGRSSP